ncbi:hypothetical protein [Psychrobacter communis]|uniref:Lipoprotein n=1 Tax=Psychrobacter communis TaxID=2762238 RepID=A0ABR8RGU2_9GAMM|nr:hypothetical protein [Psychrobacter communis]MBD7947027.1 hypothetical protein [Psychrobacter communis]
MIMKKIIVPLIGLILAGCASTPSRYAVGFDSHPQGASLICEGQNKGYTPYVAYFNNVKFVEGASNTLDLNPCHAVWSSGVRAAYPTKAPIYPSGASTYTLQRPDAPGYSQDAEFALKVKSMQANEQAAIAAHRAATAAERAVTNQNSMSYSMNQGNSFNNTVQCKKLQPSINSEIKTFSGMICPMGWMQVF